MTKILTVYYSHTGATKKVAEQVHAKLGGDIFELLPVDAYPADVGETIKRGQIENQDGVTIALQGELPNAADYDVIAVGTPNWYSTLSNPVAAYLKSQNLAGKKLAVFATHGRGGLGHIAADMSRDYAGADIAEVFDANGDGSLDEWLNSIMA
jgi:flavodoxin